MTRGGPSGPATPNGGKSNKDGDSTPGGSACDTDFTPGQNGTLSWNTTEEIDRRPILVYVFDGHELSGTDYALSRLIEVDLLKDKAVISAAEDFVNEKTCFKEANFLQAVKGREPVQGWLAANFSKPEQRHTRLALLDSGGKLLRAFDEKELRRGGAPLLVRELKRAIKENDARLAPPAKKKV